MKRKLLPMLLVLISFTSVSFAQITSAANGNWSAPATWVGGILPAATDNVVIADGHKVTVDIDCTVANLTIGAGVSGVLNFSKTAACTLTVTGNILCKVGSSLVPQGSSTGLGSILQTIVLYGNFQFDGKIPKGFNTRSGSTSTVPPTVGVLNFVFAGTGNSTISGQSFTVNDNGFNALTVNKTGGAKVILANTTYILAGSSADLASQSKLIFINGLIETGANTLVHQKADSTNVVGASNNCYVLGNFGCALSRTNRVFPIGDANGYRPIKLKSLDTAGGSSANGYHWVTAGLVDGNANTGASAFVNNIDKVSEKRYYKITYNKATSIYGPTMGFNLLCPSYGTDDGVAAGNTNLRVAYSGDERATWNGISQTTAHTTDLSNPPTMISPDSLAVPVSVADLQSFYIALSRVTGTTENSLGAAQALCKDVTLNAGWNMFGVPLNAADMTTATNFPAATSQIFAYNGGYSSVTTLVPGKGYWVRYPAETINVCGSAVTPKTIALSAGWNMISGYETDALVSALTTTPADIINSLFFGFNSGYSTPTSLAVGKGYWVRASAAGELNLPALFAKNINTGTVPTIDSKWSSVQLSDASGNKSSLYFASNAQDLSKFEMPPVPPAGIFDARFASQSMVENLGASAKVINISSATYPVEVRAEGVDLLVSDRVTGKLVNSVVKSGSSIVITNENIKSVEVSVSTKPTAFELQQNYPNPFNPSTSISFSIPQSSFVTLKVFDVIGKEIASLVNEDKSAGNYKVNFDASKFSTGVYFYRLSTSNSVITKKMTLIK